MDIRGTLLGRAVLPPPPPQILAPALVGCAAAGTGTPTSPVPTDGELGLAVHPARRAGGQLYSSFIPALVQFYSSYFPALF